MSGGEYNYAYLKVEEFADAILQPYKSEGLDIGKTVGKGFMRGNIELRERFAENLRQVAYCMQQLELADSGDISEEIAYAEIVELLFG